MKFAILTDIHLGQEFYYQGILRKANKDAKRLLDDFVKEMNNDIKPAFIVVLGDLIEDESAAEDESKIRYLVKLFEKLKYPVYYVAGNHDLKNISEEELAKLFHQKSLYYSFDSGKYHFISLFSKQLKDKSGIIDNEQKRWLQKDLKAANKKCIIFVHYSLADQDLSGNPYFDGKPHYCLVSNRKEIRNILSKSRKVIAVFNSHLHWDRMDVHDKIPYFTVQSLTENENDLGRASEAWTLVEFTDNKTRVDIKGNYPKTFVAKY